jgi:hypothetical protein
MQALIALVSLLVWNKKALGYKLYNECFSSLLSFLTNFLLCVFLHLRLANCLKTLVERKEYVDKTNHYETKKQKDNGIGKFGVFAMTTLVNSSSTMLKDRYYASQFGTTVAASTKMPKVTYFLWGTRDCMVIGSSFILPDIVCDVLTQNSDVERSTALRISQFACPVLTQFVS